MDRARGKSLGTRTRCAGTRAASAWRASPLPDARGGILPGPVRPLSLSLWVALAAPPTLAGDAPEPGLAETQAAAARRAAGEAAEDASRSARARSAHWAPV